MVLPQPHARREAGLGSRALGLTVQHRLGRPGTGSLLQDGRGLGSCKGLVGHPRWGIGVPEIHSLSLRLCVNWPQTLPVLKQCCKVPGGF